MLRITALELLAMSVRLTRSLILCCESYSCYFSSLWNFWTPRVETH